ncbi:Ataxin-7-like protein 3 [Lamellibrachia satsuma]|nr:Ataxin-7-like protein 3 [Lamellibrachia satsuma]
MGRLDVNYRLPLRGLMVELLDEVTLGLCFEIHRTCKLGTFLLDLTDEKCRQRSSTNVSVPTASVTWPLPALHPHLEKCMGMGRNSSRIASRRILNAGKKESDNESDDNDNDNDWSYLADKRAKRLKRDKFSNSPRRTKLSKLKNNGDIPSVGSTTSDGSGSQLQAYETMSLDEKRLLLTQTCGVISEHTKKMCTRSQRCPQHTEEQRKAVRQHLLVDCQENTDDVHIDIDSYDDGDSQSLRDTLQWDVTSNPSPADSISTSSTSRKCKNTSKQSRKKTSKWSERNTPADVYDIT